MWLRSVVGRITLVLTILVVPLASGGQQRAKIPRLGFLSPGSPATVGADVQAFRQGLRELGWLEGQHLVIEYRWAEGRLEQLPALAGDLVRLSVDLIVAARTAASQAAQKATTTIPIVSIASSDPVVTGLVASLAHPGGNLTGPAFQARDLGGKRLELLKDAVPQAARVAVLWNAAFPGKAFEWQATQAAAQALGVTLYSVEVRGPDDFDGAMATIARERPDALIVFSDALILTHQRRIVDFATQHRLPMMSSNKEFAESGGLMTYGASLPALFRRAAYYVDRILKGTKPADLPVEQPTKFELVLNRKTAQALGITFPPTLLILADEVLQ